MSIPVRKVIASPSPSGVSSGRRLSSSATSPRFDPVQYVAVDGYRYRPFTIAGFNLELLEPYDATSPIARFLDRRGEGVYQLSFMVDDVDVAAITLRAEGLTVLGPRTYDEGIVLEGCRWKDAFVHPRDAHGVLIFLGERTPVAGAT